MFFPQTSPSEKQNPKYMSFFAFLHDDLPFVGLLPTTFPFFFTHLAFNKEYSKVINKD